MNNKEEYSNNSSKIIKNALLSLRPVKKGGVKGKLSMIIIFVALFVILGATLISTNNIDYPAALLRISRQYNLESVYIEKYPHADNNALDIKSIRTALGDGNYYIQNNMQSHDYFYLSIDRFYPSHEFAEIKDPSFLQVLNLELLRGNFPVNPFEIMITDHVVDRHIYLQQKETGIVLTYDDILGKEFDFCGSSGRKLFTCSVSGILKTDYEEKGFPSHDEFESGVIANYKMRDYLTYTTFYVGPDFYINTQEIYDTIGIYISVAPNIAVIVLSGNYNKDLALIRKADALSGYRLKDGGSIGFNRERFEFVDIYNVAAFTFLCLCTIAFLVFMPGNARKFYETSEKKLKQSCDISNKTFKYIHLVQMLLILLISALVGGVLLSVYTLLRNLAFTGLVSISGVFTFTVLNAIILLIVGVLLYFPYQRKPTIIIDNTNSNNE